MIKRVCIGLAVAVGVCLLAWGGYVAYWYLSGSNIGCTLPALTMKREYGYYENETCFAKLQIDEVTDENLYWSNPPFCYRVILMRCTVLEDYYGTLRRGTQIVLPVEVPTNQDRGDFLAKYRDSWTDDGVFVPGVKWEGPDDEDADWMGEGVYVDVQTVMDFLTGYDTVIACFNAPREDYFYSLDSEKMVSRNYCRRVQMNNDDLFFISDGKVDFGSIDTFIAERNVYDERHNNCPIDLEDYVQDGMDADTFANNIRRLKKELFREEYYNAE